SRLGVAEGRSTRGRDGVQDCGGELGVGGSVEGQGGRGRRNKERQKWVLTKNMFEDMVERLEREDFLWRQDQDLHKDSVRLRPELRQTALSASNLICEADAFLLANSLSPAPGNQLCQLRPGGGRENSRSGAGEGEGSGPNNQKISWPCQEGSGPSQGIFGHTESKEGRG
ncbi:unnamed protein product, partial [Discosporangium mesarthrocarpum]